MQTETNNVQLVTAAVFVPVCVFQERAERTQVWPPERQSQAVSKVDRVHIEKPESLSAVAFARAASFGAGVAQPVLRRVYRERPRACCSLCNLPRNVPLQLRAHFPVTLCQRAGKAIVERVAAPAPRPGSHSTVCHCKHIKPDGSVAAPWNAAVCTLVRAPPGRTLALCLRVFCGGTCVFLMVCFWPRLNTTRP